MKKHLLRMALGLVIVLAFIGHAAGYYRLPFVEKLEAIAYDARLRLTMPGGVDERIVIVDVDEKSLAAEGHWPWPRDKMALMIDRLFEQYKVALVGFDVVWPEKDDTSGLPVLERLARNELKGVPQFHSALERIAPDLDYDRQFAQRLKGKAVVLGYYFSNQTAAGKPLALGLLPEPVLPPGTFKGRNIFVHAFDGYGANLPELQRSAASAGHFTPIPDPDGVTRRVPMLIEHDGAYYEALALAMVRLAVGSPALQPGYPAEPFWSRKYPGLEWLEAGRVKVPVDDEVNALVPYRGAHPSFRYLSATDVLAGRADPAALSGKIVLVGTTAPGLQDLRSAPVGPVYPGVEIHANLIAGMFEGDIKQRPPYVLGAEVTLLFLSGTLIAVVLPLVSPLRATLITVLFMALVFAVNLLVWDKGNLVLPMAGGLLMIVLLFALNMSYGFFVEARAKRQITGRFGQYVPPELVEEMARNPTRFSMEGESREMSVLFSDVRGFTTISEKLDPRQLTELMNEFLTPLTQVIYRHRGTIDKYMGDAIMAFWGAPLSDPAHARNAILAGLEMHATMQALRPQFEARGWPPLHIGVGVNSGRMSVGNMGSEIRVAYTVMGDAVNLASRLEGLTKEYGVGMIVGEATRAAVPEVLFRELDRVRVKGKHEPVAIFEPVALAAAADKPKQDEIALFQQALRLYRAQDWDMAELQLINLQKSHPDAALYRRYLERVAALRQNPPGPGWDGTYTFEHK